MKTKQKYTLWGVTLLAFALLAALATPAQAVLLQAASSDEQRAALQAASREIAERHPSVGYNVGWLDGEDTKGGGVVLVSTDPPLVVTASHVTDRDPADGDTPAVEYDYIEVGFGENWEEETSEDRIRVVDKFRHPELDFAIYLLETAPEGIEPATISETEPVAGEYLEFVGPGELGHVGDSGTSTDGTRHGFVSKIERQGWSQWPLYYMALFANEAFHPFFHSEGGVGINGDSGGGVFRDVEGQFELVGITTISTGNSSGARTGLISVAMPNIAAFITETVESLSQTEPILATPLEDSDEDGTLDLFEYAAGSDWQDAASVPLPEPPPVWRGEGDRRMQVYCYLKRIDGTVNYVGQQSSDLENWYPAKPCDPPEDVGDAPPGMEWGCFEIPGNLRANFYRLQISLVP